MALPLGELSPQVTERAHAVSPVTKVSNATRNLSVIAKSSPFGGAGTPSGVTERVRSNPSREKAILENPQIFQNCEIINILSAIDAQSNAERIQNRPLSLYNEN